MSSNKVRPNKTKYKHHFAVNRKVAGRSAFFKHGQWGLKSLESGKVTDKQLETIQNIFNYMKRKMKISSCRLYKNAFPHHAYSKKPVGHKMGKGKGSIDHFGRQIAKNEMILEINGSETFSKEVLQKMLPVMSFRCIIVERYI